MAARVYIYASLNGSPVTGLTLSDFQVDIVRVTKSDKSVSLIISNAAMQFEAGNGYYSYYYDNPDFVTYDYLASVTYAGSESLDAILWVETLEDIVSVAEAEVGGVVTLPLSSRSLELLRQDLSDFIGDLNIQDTTASGGDATSVKSANLDGKKSNWLSDGAGGRQVSTVLFNEGTNIGQEREVSSFSVASSPADITTRAFSATTENAKEFEVHRLATALEKERAIRRACYEVFPDLYTHIDSLNLRFGDWFENGGMQIWSQSTYPDFWRVSGGVTATRNSTDKYLKWNPYNTKLVRASTNGTFYQTEEENKDLWLLADCTISFYAWVWCNTPSCLTLVLYDGVTTTYGNHSSHDSASAVYHPGDSTWRLMWVRATIATNPTEITPYVSMVADGTAYIEDARLYGPNSRISYDISNLGLRSNNPSQVHIVPSMLAGDESPSTRLHSHIIFGWRSQTGNGRLHFTETLRQGEQLRIIGMGDLAQPGDTNRGDSVTNSVNVGKPYSDLIIAKAACILAEKRIFESPDQEVTRWGQVLEMSRNKYEELRYKYSMPHIAGTALYHV